jgi:hypothetical protein
MDGPPRERGYGDQGTEYTFSEADVCSYFGSFSESFPRWL